MAKLYFRYGCVNSAKSMLMLATAHNYEENDKKVIIFTPYKDERNPGIISSRVGLSKEAIVLSEDSNPLEIIATIDYKIDCILVDEVQFLEPSQIFNLCQIVDEFNIPVIAYGLKSDFKTEIFESIKILLAMADSIEEIKNICGVCGKKKAILNGRKNGNQLLFDGNTIEVGGNEKYIALCRRCYNQLKNYNNIKELKNKYNI